MAHNTDGGSAFPGFQHFIAQREDSKGPVQIVTGEPHGGLSMRDYFAAQYLAGRAARESVDDADATANFAYDIADAMLRARAAQSPADVQRAHLDEFGK